MPLLPIDNPHQWFARWIKEAEQSQELEPTAMSLATVGATGRPAVRIVLLKAFDDKGFVFYTNLTSRKAQELKASPVAALTFFWKVPGRQVRIEGAVEQVSDAEADAYFATRPRGSQIGAWASEQSQPLESREALKERVLAVEERFRGQEVRRPPFWSGFRIIPDRFEFWQAGPFRLHDRWEFVPAQEPGQWVRRRLNP